MSRFRRLAIFTGIFTSKKSVILTNRRHVRNTENRDEVFGKFSYDGEIEAASLKGQMSWANGVNTHRSNLYRLVKKFYFVRTMKKMVLLIFALYLKVEGDLRPVLKCSKYVKNIV